jgi:hypothetical protein
MSSLWRVLVVGFIPEANGGLSGKVRRRRKMAQGIGKGRTVIVNDKVKTCAAQYSKFKDMFVPNWDSPPGSEQESLRVAQRAEMGNKETPRGAGKLLKPI